MKSPQFSDLEYLAEMRLTQRQEAARTSIQQLVVSALAPTELADRICAALGQAIPNDGYRLFGIDPTTMLVNRLLAASESDEWARREWLSEVYLAADALSYVELPTLMRLRLPVVASQARQSICWGYPAEVLSQLTDAEHERAFYELGSPHGGTILACFASRGRWVAALQLYRRDPDEPFSRSDVAFLRSLATTIGEGLDAAATRERALSCEQAMDSVSGILILDRDGRVQFATPAGERWLDQLRSIESGASEWLPTPIAAAVAGLRANQRPSQQVTTLLSPGSLRVEASPGGSDGAVAIVMALQQPPSAPTIPPEWPLTPQEREVAGLLIQGKANRAIAETLFITENTVQSHLRRIYAKLEVSGRTQLLARLFRECSDVYPVAGATRE